MEGRGVGQWRFVGGTDPHDLDAGPVARIVDELTLRVEMADRTVVSRAVLALAMARTRLVLGAELRRCVTEAGQGVECRAAQRHDPVEAEQSGQQKLVGTPTHHAEVSLWKDVARGDRSPMTISAERGQIHSDDQFGQMTAELSIGFPNAGTADSHGLIRARPGLATRVFLCYF